MKKIIIKLVSLLVFTVISMYSFDFPAFASEPNVDFIDVSHHNNEAGLSLAFYQTIKKAGVHAVVVKVSEDRYFVDPAASVNIANAKQAGMIVHAYHYARYTNNEIAKAEAQWFDKKLKLVGFDKNQDGYVVVDVEAVTLSNSPARLTEYTNTFVQEMYKLGYNKIDIYSGSYFYNYRLLPSSLIITKPWLASYPMFPVKGQPTAVFPSGAGAWQWASDYRFTGLSAYGAFDVSEDYAGKYTNQVKSSSPIVGKLKTLSLVDYLQSIKKDSSFSNRAALAEEFGIPNYSGTSSQNLALLSKLKSGTKPAKVNFMNSLLKPLSEPDASANYIVQKGDTLSGIANKFKTSVSHLAATNQIENKNFIRTGQVLKIVSKERTIRSYSVPVYHLVRRGDTVSELALSYGSAKRQIQVWNHLNKSYLIYVGQKLRVK